MRAWTVQIFWKQSTTHIPIDRKTNRLRDKHHMRTVSLAQETIVITLVGIQKECGMWRVQRFHRPESTQRSLGVKPYFFRSKHLSQLDNGNPERFSFEFTFDVDCCHVLVSRGWNNTGRSAKISATHIEPTLRYSDESSVYDRVCDPDNPPGFEWRSTTWPAADDEVGRRGARSGSRGSGKT